MIEPNVGGEQMINRFSITHQLSVRSPLWFGCWQLGRFYNQDASNFRVNQC